MYPVADSSHISYPVGGKSSHSSYPVAGPSTQHIYPVAGSSSQHSYLIAGLSSQQSFTAINTTNNSDDSLPQHNTVVANVVSAPHKDFTVLNNTVVFRDSQLSSLICALPAVVGLPSERQSPTHVNITSVDPASVYLRVFQFE